MVPWFRSVSSTLACLLLMPQTSGLALRFGGGGKTPVEQRRVCPCAGFLTLPGLVEACEYIHGIIRRVVIPYSDQEFQGWVSTLDMNRLPVSYGNTHSFFLKNRNFGAGAIVQWGGCLPCM